MDTTKADDCMKQHMAELKDKHPEMAHDQMIAIAMSKCGMNKELELLTDTKANTGDNPNEWAYVPDKESPSNWKLDISDEQHIAGAITALTSGFRGNKVEIPSADKPKVIAKIRARINKIVSDKDSKARLLERLDKVKEYTTKMMMLLTQDEANYTPVSVTVGKACSGCRFFCEDHCHIVMGEIAPNGLCDRYEAPPTMTEPAPMPVTIVEPDDMMEMSTDEQSLYDRIWGRIEKALPDFLKPQPEGVFSVQKDLNGQWRWMATFSNNFKDREREIISEKAWDGYIARLDMGLVPMPELWTAHISETKQGKADHVFAIGNFVIATGTFDDTPDAQKAIQYYRKNAAKVQLSHGFTYPNWALKGGVYEEINTFEITTLPPPLVASNPFTDMEVSNMKQITPETEAALAQIYGKEYVENLKANREQMSKDLVQAGIAYKDFADAAGAVTDAEAETPTDAKANPLATMLQSMIDDMGELLQSQIDNGKAFANYRAQKDAELKALTDKVAVLEQSATKVQAELALTPKRASESRLTQIDLQDAKKLIGEPEPEVDPFFS